MTGGVADADSPLAAAAAVRQLMAATSGGGPTEEQAGCFGIPADRSRAEFWGGGGLAAGFSRHDQLDYILYAIIDLNLPFHGLRISSEERKVLFNSLDPQRREKSKKGGNEYSVEWPYLEV